jgi:hypothetical protein
MTEQIEIEIPCPQCGGTGIIGEVSREMAIDGGDRSLEGQIIECDVCRGGGFVSGTIDKPITLDE